jgi:hypothetical protein
MDTMTNPMVVPGIPQEETTSQTSNVTPSPGTASKVPTSSQYNRCTTNEWEYMTDVICGAETGNRPPMPKEIKSFLQDKFQATDSLVRALENLEIQDMPTLINAMAAGPEFAIEFFRIPLLRDPESLDAFIRLILFSQGLTGTNRKEREANPCLVFNISKHYYDTWKLKMLLDG